MDTIDLYVGDSCRSSSSRFDAPGSGDHSVGVLDSEMRLVIFFLSICSLVGFLSATSCVRQSSHGLYSNMSANEIPKYQGSFTLDGTTLVIEMNNMPGLMIHRIDHAFENGNLYLSAHRISTGSGLRTYRIDLKDFPAIDLKKNLYWINPDSTAERIDAEYIK